MNAIIVYRTPKGWMADKRMAADAADIQRLFGTTVLPTAWTAQAEWETVKAGLERLNPGMEIVRVQDMR